MNAIEVLRRQRIERAIKRRNSRDETNVTFRINVDIRSLDEFDEVRKLCVDMREHYQTYRPKYRYQAFVANATGDGFVASAVRIEPKDWRVAYSRVAYSHSNSGE